MAQPIPVFLTLHAEPDGLYLKQSENGGWIGLERALDFVQELRDQNALTDVNFIWLLRADPQIDIVYGDAGWGFKTYKSQITRLLEAGDQAGIHVHPYRLIGDEWKWVQDFSDQDWMSHCVKMAVDTFKENLQMQPLSLSIGPNSTSTRVVNNNRALGLRYDFTISHNGKKVFNQSKGEIKGEMNWFKELPAQPYVPSFENLAVEDPTLDDYYMIPVHYFRFLFSRNRVRAAAKRLLKGKSSYSMIKPSLRMPPEIFRQIFEMAAERGLKYLVIDTRTHAFCTSEAREVIRENVNYLTSLNGSSVKVVLPEQYVPNSRSLVVAKNN